MGLDTSHDCWHGPYGSFQIFRLHIARAAGIPIGIQTDPEDWDYGRERMKIDWDIYPDECYQGRWRKAAPYWVPEDRADDIYGWYDNRPRYDDVLYLLIHSDCDGKLRRGYLPRLKARLEELLPAYEAQFESLDDFEQKYTKGRLRQFIDGLQRAIDDDEHVDFH